MTIKAVSSRQSGISTETHNEHGSISAADLGSFYRLAILTGHETRDCVRAYIIPEKLRNAHTGQCIMIASILCSTGPRPLLQKHALSIIHSKRICTILIGRELQMYLW